MRKVIFYSDNCAEQITNMLFVYFYAIGHKGHYSQILKNMTHSKWRRLAHSLIEKQIKWQFWGGTIYTPEGFINAIIAAKSGPHKITWVMFWRFLWYEITHIWIWSYPSKRCKFYQNWTIIKTVYFGLHCSLMYKARNCYL